MDEQPQIAGTHPAFVNEIRSAIAQAPGTSFIYDEEEDSNDHIAHIYFVGSYQGQPAVYSAVIFTLMLAYDSLVYQAAEQQAQEQYPGFTPAYVNDDTGEEVEATGSTEEIEEYIAERMFVLEEEDQLKVSESVEIDPDFEPGIGLTVALNVPELNDEEIERFVKLFARGQFVPDDTLFSFPGGDEDDEDEDGDEEA